MSLLSILIILNMPMRDPEWPATDVSPPFTTPVSTLRSPEDALTLWQWLTVSWMAPMISLGNQRQLHDDDVWFLPFEFQHGRLYLLFREIKGSVVGRLLRANAPDLFITSGLGILESAMSMSSVVFLKQLLAALEGDSPRLRVAVTYAVLTLLGRWIAAQSGVFTLWFSRRSYERSRGEMITMIYEKTLRRKAFTFPSGHKMEGQPNAGLSPESNGVVVTAEAIPKASVFQRLTSCFRQRKGYREIQTRKEGEASLAASPASTGKILNLMRNDVYEVAQRFWEFASLITKPLNCLLSLVLLWRFLGPGSLLGIAILLACQLVNVIIVRTLLRIERARRAITDAKLQLTSQFVEAIRHLRWYNWQDAWLKQILESRQQELNKRVLANILNRAVATFNNLSSFLFPVAGFYGYTVLTGKPLTVEIAFPALDLFTMLETSLREIPDLITVLLNARIAVGRIEAFMAEPDKEGEGDGHGEVAAPPDERPFIETREASFSWPGSTTEILRRVSLSCRPGLTVVCGEVGVGKTALLHAILGELDQQGGERRVPGEMIGYCSQSPWLQSMSIRENILFSAEYDERRYKQTLDACCLLADLSGFKAGDLSLIGENGIGLSGGQRARVALARAVYSRSRILLLDDPIAALDHQTAETILRKLFANRESPLMAGRLVVFVTHRVDLITRYADQVLDVVRDGTVTTINREELETNEELRHLAATAAIHDDGAAADEDAANPESNAVPDKFIEEEHRATGGVMASVYWRYIKAGSLKWWFATIALFVAFRITKVVYFLFLKRWSEAYDQSPVLWAVQGADGDGTHIRWNSYANGSLSGDVNLYGSDRSSWLDIDLGLPNPAVNINPWLYCFLALSLSQVVTFALSDLSLVVIIYKAGKHLFAQVMRRVSNATFRFYDVTPTGRLMNRVTSDISTMDGQIAGQLTNMGWFSVSWISSVVVIAAVTPLFLVLTLAMTALFVYIFRRFLPASQSLRRLEMTSLSPLMSNFGTLLDGLTTVRAFRAQPHFQTRIVNTTDNFQKMDHFYWSLQAWLMYRFDTLSALSTFAMTITALASGLSSGSSAFVLASAGNFVTSTHTLCRKYGEMQMQFVSVERVIELLDLDQEPRGDLKPPAAWPTYSDDIVFDHVTLRYAPGLDPSLRDVSFRVPAGSTVAVTGRTGSGKSTLALSLLGTLLPDENDVKNNDDNNDGNNDYSDNTNDRGYSNGNGDLTTNGGEMIRSGGTIYIGSVDVARVDKHVLRGAVSFVAQDPVLFPGSVRDNLDPLREHSEADCAATLARVLGRTAGDLKLDSRVDGGGKNLSQGQRQLVGLGRAILRRSPVVILDEVSLFFFLWLLFWLFFVFLPPNYYLLILGLQYFPPHRPLLPST